MSSRAESISAKFFGSADDLTIDQQPVDVVEKVGRHGPQPEDLKHRFKLSIVDSEFFFALLGQVGGKIFELTNQQKISLTRKIQMHVAQFGG